MHAQQLLKSKKLVLNSSLLLEIWLMPKMNPERYQRNTLKNGRCTSLQLNKAPMVPPGTICVEIMIALIWFRGKQKATSTRTMEKVQKYWMTGKVFTAGKCQRHLATINSLLWIHGKMVVYVWVHSSLQSPNPSPRKGPSRPFNFFGYLTTNTMNRLVSKIMPSTFNHTFLVILSHIWKKRMYYSSDMMFLLVFSLSYNNHVSRCLIRRIHI